LVTFLLTAWTIFLVLVRKDGWIPDNLRPHLGFVWNLWATNPVRAFLMANIGIVVQHSWGQIVYVSLLLVLVGLAYEARNGSLRTFLMFYGACVTGVAVLCIVILTTWFNGPHGWNEYLARTSWSGASVGAFGLLGATLATARKPWILLGAWIAFEAIVEWGLVPGLAVTMHIAGFLFGFTASRWIHSGGAVQASMPSPPEPQAVASPAEDDGNSAP
jgi:hypothetical protein